MHHVEAVFLWQIAWQIPPTPAAVSSHIPAARRQPFAGEHLSYLIARKGKGC